MVPRISATTRRYVFHINGTHPARRKALGEAILRTLPVTLDIRSRTSCSRVGEWDWGGAVRGRGRGGGGTQQEPAGNPRNAQNDHGADRQDHSRGYAGSGARVRQLVPQVSARSRPPRRRIIATSLQVGASHPTQLSPACRPHPASGHPGPTASEPKSTDQQQFSSPEQDGHQPLATPHS
jgi:hypothetical protein